MDGPSPHTKFVMTTLARISLFFAAACAAAPLGAQDTAQAPAAPRCVRAAMPAADSAFVRYDCAGTGDWARVGYSVSLPAAWAVEESGDRQITLTARNGVPLIAVQGSDELFVPVTPADSAEFWAVAAELLLDHPPTAREVEELKRDAGDEAGARFVLTRAQSTDSALVALTSMLNSTRQDVERITQVGSVDTLAGRRAGRLVLRTAQDGEVFRRLGYVTVHDGVFYGIVVQSLDTEWDAHRALWERVVASFVIQPPRS